LVRGRGCQKNERNKKRHAHDPGGKYWLKNAKQLKNRVTKQRANARTVKRKPDGKPPVRKWNEFSTQMGKERARS